MAEIGTNLTEVPLLEAAKILYEAGEIEEALRITKKVKKIFPQSVEVELLLGSIYLDLDKPELVESSLKKALKLQPENAEAMKNLAFFLDSHGRESEAIGFLVDYLKIVSWNDWEALEVLTESCETNQRDVVLLALQEAWTSTLNPEIGFIYATQLRLSGKFSEAQPIIELLVKHSPTPKIFNECGIIYHYQKKYDQSAGMYQQAIAAIKLQRDEGLYPLSEDYSLSKNEAIYRSNLSGCYLAAHKKEEALAEAERALKLDPLYGYHWIAKVNALEALKRYQETADIAGIVLEKDREGSFLEQSEREKLLLLRAESLKNVSGNLIRAFFDDGHTFDGQYSMQAENFFTFDDYKSAKKVIKHALKREKLEPGFLKQSEKDALYYLEKLIKIDLQMLKNCLPVCLEGVLTYPKNQKFPFLAAGIYEKLGQFDEAIKMFECGFQTVLKLSPRSSDSGVRSADLYGRLDDYYLLLHKVGLGETAWEKYLQFAGNKLEEFSLSLELNLNEMFAGYQAGPLAEIIEQIYEHQPDFPQSIDFMFRLRFQQDRLDDCIAIMQRAYNAPLSNKYRVRFLNNMGYVQILQGRLKEAGETLERALTLGEDSLESITGLKVKASDEIGLGVAFFLDGNVLSFDWIDTPRVIAITPVHFWQPAQAIEAVKSNLATLALARGDIDEANVLATEILCMPGEYRFQLKPRYLVLLFLAHFRKDFKTARFAWQKYLRTLDSHYDTKEPELFKKKFPELDAWLSSAN